MPNNSVAKVASKIEDRCAGIVALYVQLQRCVLTKERIKAAGSLISAVESLSEEVDIAIE